MQVDEGDGAAAMEAKEGDSEDEFQFVERS